LERLCRSPARPPLVALVHWGREYTATAGDEERAIAEALAACGVSFVVGAHSHRSSRRPEPIAGGEALMFFSLGNLLFDQRSPYGSGALLELRWFKQGTFAARVIALPNLYDAAVGTD
jgi:poly-gamma-glutamate synthesis protein (capsule biosynthesis protein)